MRGTSYKTAAPGTPCCFLCHRYLDEEKLEGGRCVDRDACRRAIARLLGRAPKLSKRDKRALGIG